MLLELLEDKILGRQAAVENVRLFQYLFLFLNGTPDSVFKVCKTKYLASSPRH